LRSLPAAHGIGEAEAKLFADEGAKVASDEASFVTGPELVIDSGFIAQ
jgi:hypothetical protein